MPNLQFKGRVFVENHHLAVPYHEWRPIRSKGLSSKASLHDNLIIEGDNLAALKALLPTHHRKIKCIYIDPPYNTGNEGLGLQRQRQLTADAGLAWQGRGPGRPHPA